MQLKDLLQFDDIVIQCHDNPDADALASGYGLYRYFESNHKKVRFIYRGLNPIRKSNLMIMLDELKVPVSYEPDLAEVQGLLITVDCQYGQKNVTLTKASQVAMIDHHQLTVPQSPLSEIRSNLGSASTIVWDMMREEGYLFRDDPLLSTALYYGLYTDTNRLAELSHPLDRDMLEDLDVYKTLIARMNNSNISLNELKITGKAILGYDYHETDKYLILQAEPCDPNILGVISDFSLETEGVDVCVAYYVTGNEIKFSVRSCIKEVHANELASFIAEGIGGGGGHLYKAGGTIRPEKLESNPAGDLNGCVRKLFLDRISAYFDKYEIIYAQKTVLDPAGMKRYQKLPQEMGMVKLTDVFEEGSIVEIRTLEGDVQVRIEKNTCLMIGIEGEVYPITKETFKKSYRKLGHAYSGSFEYAPSIRNIQTNEKKQVLPYASAVISTGQSAIYAKQLTSYVKLFTAWDEEKYYSGEPGDYIAYREDDPHDIYVIKNHLFDRLYSPSSLRLNPDS